MKKNLTNWAWEFKIGGFRVHILTLKRVLGLSFHFFVFFIKIPLSPSSIHHNIIMDKYFRVEQPKQESPINENEIRITTQGLIRDYISYATTLLQVFYLLSTFFSWFSLLMIFLSWYFPFLMGFLDPHLFFFLVNFFAVQIKVCISW